MELLKQLRQLEEEHLARRTYSSYYQRTNCVNYPPYPPSSNYYQSGCYPSSSPVPSYPDYNSQSQPASYYTQYGTGAGSSPQYGYGSSGYGSTSQSSGNLFGIGTGFNLGLPYGMGVGVNSGLGVNLG